MCAGTVASRALRNSSLRRRFAQLLRSSKVTYENGVLFIVPRPVGGLYMLVDAEARADR